MKIKIKKLHPDAEIPQYAKPGDSGFDLRAIEDVSVSPGQTKLVPSGLAFEIPAGYEMQVRPRSGLSLKTAMHLRNAPGTVDSGYRNDVGIIVCNLPFSIDGRLNDETLDIKKGDRIAQGVICPVIRAEFEEVATLAPSERDLGGFGHTGK